MRILCTNDDGYMAPGLAVLRNAARRLGSVDVVAPDREQSATSHSLTLHHPLRARSTPDGASVVDGTPTDCILVALGALLEERPVFCLSGVNHGSNMGEDVFYSGTVAAAMEATVLGIPSVAVSYAGRDFAEGLGWSGPLSDLLEQVLARPFPVDTLFNINLPPIPPARVRGVRITELGRRRYSDSMLRGRDPMGREYYWIGGSTPSWTGNSDSDFRAVEEGWVSVTPLHLDLTNHKLLQEVRAWDLSL